MNLKNLRKMEKRYVYNELKKIDNATDCYKNYSLFNSLSVMFFVMSLIVIVTACIYQERLININNISVMIFISVLALLAFISLIISIFYNFKTIDLVKQYYKSVN